MLQPDHSSGARPTVERAAVIAVLAVCLALGARNGTPPLVNFYRDVTPMVQRALTQWDLPRGGESVLPSKVRAMISLLREHRVTEFRYSETIARDSDEVRQRLAEGAYPIRMSARARHVLMTRTDAVPARCRLLASGQEVVLADCG